MKKFISAFLIATVILSALSLSACDDHHQQESDISAPESITESSVDESSQESQEESQVSEVSKTAISSEQIAQMSSELSNHYNIPQFESDNPLIDATAVTKGKTITLVTDNLNLSYTKLVVDQFKIAAESAGFPKIIVSKTDGTDTSINEALNNAVNDKSDIIVMFGNINKDTVSSNIEYAQANGIEVISAGCVGVNQNDHFADYTMPVDYQLIGKSLAQWIIVKTNGNANVLAVNCTDSILSNTIAGGFKNEFDEYIAGATGYCTGINASSIEIGNGLSDKIKQAIQTDTNLNYIVVFDENMIGDTVTAVSQSGKKIPIISTGGSDNAFDAAKNADIEMLIAQSFEWTAYGMVDYAMRILAKTDLPKEQYVPFRILTAERIIDEINNFGGLSGNFNLICFGSYFEYGYDYLWHS